MLRGALNGITGIHAPSTSGRRVDLADSILYLCALIADQPRPIDRIIDYFGETPPFESTAAAA